MEAEHDFGRGETPAVNNRAVMFIAAGILAGLVATAFGFTLLFGDRIGVTFVDRHRFTAPGVTPDERTEREALEARQRDALEGSDGRISIEAAMRMIAAKGPHAFDPIEAAR